MYYIFYSTLKYIISNVSRIWHVTLCYDDHFVMHTHTHTQCNNLFSIQDMGSEPGLIVQLDMVYYEQKNPSNQDLSFHKWNDA